MGVRWMNRVFFDIGVFLYCSEESLDSKRLTSKGSLIVSNNDAFQAFTESNAGMDPDIEVLLKSLREDGFSLNICDVLPLSQIRDGLKKLGIHEYFDEIVSAKTIDAMARGLAQTRGRDDFAIVVSSDELILDAATREQFPSVSYGWNWKKTAHLTFSYARYPLELDDQIHLISLVHTVVKKAILSQARILGIDGISFAGKKVFAENLGRYLTLLGKEYTVVDLEDFHRADEENYKGEDPVEAYYFNGYNNEKLIEEVLKPFVKQGKLDTVVYCLDSTNDSFANERHYQVSENGLMILLGTMMYREPLIRYFDMTIYMRVDYREAEHRASLMEEPLYGEDPLEVYKTRNIPAQKMYVQRHDPFSDRDFVIDNSNYHRPFFIQ